MKTGDKKHPTVVLASHRLTCLECQQVSGEYSDREAYVLAHRLQSPQPQTLRSIGRDLGISPERVRQIEDKANCKKRWAAVRAAAKEPVEYGRYDFAGGERD